MKAIYWFGAIVLIFGGIIAFEIVHYGALATSQPQDTTEYPMMLDGATLMVSLARTPAVQEQGLGGRNSLGSNEGMLFVFPTDGHNLFWMKDMRFSIDIIWLDSAGRVVYIVPDLSPATYPQTFGPSLLSRFVLEVPAGWTAAHQTQIGDTAQLP